MARSDPWHCASCGVRADLAPRSVEVALVRLAVLGDGDFALGSRGIECEIAPLLEPCACGGRFEPGEGAGSLVRLAFDRDRLLPLAVAGHDRLERSTDETVLRLRDVWQPRLLVLLGREEELEREDVLRLRLEAKLEALQYEVERATIAGDQETAEAAHARYIELGTTYVRRFVADERAQAH
jgi:hypothetical protein